MRIGQAAPSSDPITLAFLSDPHISGNPEVSAHGVNMTANLKQVVKEVQGLATRPAGVIINGDCAYLKGQPADYANFVQCLEPLISSGQTLHMTMGNHDARDAFYDALKQQQPDQPLVKSRHVSLIETPFANLFLLDSLKQTNVVTGELGQAQLKWLSEALDARPNQPAILIAHHTLQLTPPAAGKAWGGIAETAEFLELMHSKKQVKAYVFGHSHRWSHTQDKNLHLVNLPAVAYVFDKTQPNGWTTAQLGPQGIQFQLQALDKNHQKHQEVVNVNW